MGTSAAERVLDVAGHRLVIEAGTVTVDAAPVHLSAAPLAVLLALARRPGHVVSRRDLMEHLPTGEATIARVLKGAGYATACVGKWHLGGPDHYPEAFGFDRNVAGTDKPAPRTYFAPWGIPTLPEGKGGEYLTDRLGDEAVKFIEANKDRP